MKFYFVSPIGQMLAVSFLLIATQACHKDSLPQRQEMPLEKYGFQRTVYDTTAHEFLMGNGEMGGRIRHSGLGLDRVWFSDYWKNPAQRQCLQGPALHNELIDAGSPETYHSELDIAKAVCLTKASYSGGVAYSSRLFFSFEDDGLLALEVTNESEVSLTFDVSLPLDNFVLLSQGEFRLTARNKSSQDYNQAAWSLASNQSFKLSGTKVTLSIPSKERLQLLYRVATQYDEYFDSLAAGVGDTAIDFERAYSDHLANWNNMLKGIGSIIIPDSDYAKWFYRSIYTNYATAGSKKFLAAETQFAYPEVDWDMHAFTYGHGSWAALSFLQLGDSVRAKRSLEWLYQPQSLKKNLHILIPDTGDIKLTYRGQPVVNSRYLDSYPPEAFAFAHEQTDFGLDIPYEGDAHWDMQFHLNGFAASLFHRYNQYYRDSTFEREVVFPVIKGTAELWSGLLKENESGGLFLPPMLSLSENIIRSSVLDAVLAARWNLSVAGDYEYRLGGDKAHQYQDFAKRIMIPQNDSMYLEYDGDNQSRTGGGYFGIRASAYLGFPVLEQLKDIDKKKARNTLDNTWERNNHGKGMISFIANWFSLTESYFKDGDKALAKSSMLLNYEDPNDVLLYEAFTYRGDTVKSKFNPYFLTGYSSLSLVPISMVLQSYDDTLFFFPAIPTAWNHVEFYNLPAAGGCKVSGVYHGKGDFEVWIEKGNKVAHFKNRHEASLPDLLIELE